MIKKVVLDAWVPKEDQETRNDMVLKAQDECGRS